MLFFGEDKLFVVAAWRLLLGTFCLKHVVAWIIGKLFRRR